MTTAAILLKQKLRALKKLETALRGPGQPSGRTDRLVWEVFFSTRPQDRQVKYPFEQLLAMDHEGIKQVIQEYFGRVYAQKLQGNGLPTVDLYDPELLALLDLPPYANGQEVKKRFRELAMRTHPDRGGDSEQFLTLMKVYKKLSGEVK